MEAPVLVRSKARWLFRCGAPALPPRARASPSIRGPPNPRGPGHGLRHPTFPAPPPIRPPPPPRASHREVRPAPSPPPPPHPEPWSQPLDRRHLLIRGLTAAPTAASGAPAAAALSACARHPGPPPTHPTAAPATSRTAHGPTVLGIDWPQPPISITHTVPPPQAPEPIIEAAARYLTWRLQPAQQFLFAQAGVPPIITDPAQQRAFWSKYHMAADGTDLVFPGWEPLAARRPRRPAPVPERPARPRHDPRQPPPPRPGDRTDDGLAGTDTRLGPTWCAWRVQSAGRLGQGWQIPPSRSGRKVPKRGAEG